jgi:beta-glucosidase
VNGNSPCPLCGGADALGPAHVLVRCAHPVVAARRRVITDGLPVFLADLVGRLTIEEAAAMTGDAGDAYSPCATNTGAIPRLDVSAYRWLVEVSSMAGSIVACSLLTPFGGGCPTSFPAAMLLAGAFNRSLWRRHGEVVGDEMRAMSNFATTALSGFAGGQASLAGHGPDINQPRDPRNGRIGELASEDPLLSGAFATEYVAGMQFGRGGARAVNATTRRMLASLKHYNAYSRETDRMGSEGNVSIFDLWDTYLPAYKQPLTEALAAGTSEGGAEPPRGARAPRSA